MSRKESLLGNFKGVVPGRKENSIDGSIQDPAIKLKCQENISEDVPIRAGRGKPKSSIGSGRVSRQVTTVLYDENKYYCKVRATQLKRQRIGQGGIADYLNWLIDQDKQEHPESVEKARMMQQLEEDI